MGFLDPKDGTSGHGLLCMLSDFMTINEQHTDAKEFAYDGCHKIYLLESEDDRYEAEDSGYEIHDIGSLRSMYNASCGLQFISNWKMDKSFVKQFEQWED